MAYLDDNGNPIASRRAIPRPPNSPPPPTTNSRYRDPVTGQIVNRAAPGPRPYGNRNAPTPAPSAPSSTPPPSNAPTPATPDSWRASWEAMSRADRLDAIRSMLKLVNAQPGGWFEALKPGSMYRQWLEERGVEVQTASDGTPRGRIHYEGLDPEIGFKEFGWGLSPLHGPEGGESSEPYGANAYGRNFSFPEFTEEFAFEPWERDFSFTPPGQEQIEADPVYQQRIAAAQKAIERSAAARGSLLGKGTMMELSRENQAIASEEGDKIYGRRLGEALTDYNLDRDAYLDRQDQRLGEYGLRYAKYGDDFSRALSTEGFNYGIFGDDWSRARTASQDLFSNNMSRAQLGLDAERLQLSAEQAYWDNYFSNTDPSAANENRSRLADARAAGQAASGSQWSNGLNNSSRLIGDYLSRRRYGSSYQPTIPGRTQGPF